MKFVPVFNMKNEPLMPTTWYRAKRWIKTRKATPFYKKGVFCVRLNVKTEENKQSIAIGVDAGIKKEGFTVKSKFHTYINTQADAVNHVKKAMEIRKIMRRGRRGRKTPCRQPRYNRAKGGIAPSIRARYQWKLRILKWLGKLYPITNIIVEDIKAKTKGQKRWDKSFSPLEIGKKWFYAKLDNLTLIEGYETKKEIN